MFRMVARLKADGLGNAPEIALDESDPGALHGDVGAGAHGDADVSGGERGGIVDAVASHRDALAVGSATART